MKRFHLAWAFAALFLVAACGDDGGGTTTDTTNGTDTVTTDTNTNANTSSVTGVSSEGVTCTEPTPAAGCTGANSDASNVGFEYPWCGLTAGSTTYTCQGCPMGRLNFQGKYRAVKDGLASPPVLDFDNYKETLFIDGNTFSIHIVDDSGGVTTGKGWFMCAEKPEQLNEHTYWMFTEASSPDGAWTAGTVLESDHIIVQGTDQAVISWYDSVGAQTYVDLEYCRIGSQLSGVECTDPFAN
ncbi:MAG: hypothetical protein EP329_13415 [Deltaproteobacteria bacterium]|nr:MAG: hypothetical protein EP329_13415 [Deltaproteobacteria bacterium]